MAKGYVVAHLDIHDPEGFEKYREKVPATIEQYAGTYIVRGGTMEMVEGDALPPRTIILEFPSLSQAKKWYNSPEHQEIIRLQLATATGYAQFVEGGLVTVLFRVFEWNDSHQGERSWQTGTATNFVGKRSALH